MNFSSLRAFFCHLLLQHMKVLHAKSIATANSMADFRESLASYKARSLPEKATLTGDFALFHPGRSERSWGLNGAFYLLAPQPEQRFSLGEWLPNVRLSSQRWDVTPAANALPQDWGFSNISSLSLSPPPSPRVIAVVTNFGIARVWYIH